MASQQMPLARAVCHSCHLSQINHGQLACIHCGKLLYPGLQAKKEGR